MAISEKIAMNQVSTKDLIQVEVSTYRQMMTIPLIILDFHQSQLVILILILQQHIKEINKRRSQMVMNMHLIGSQARKA